MTVTVESTKSTNRPKRAFCSHIPKWQRFQPTLLKPETKKAQQKDQEPYQYQRQYSHVYSHRLAALKPRCWKQFDSNEPTCTRTLTRIDRILELREDVPSQVVGTLVKEVNDPKEEPIHPTSNCRPSDQLFLEDESGRVALELEQCHHFCTGVVIGVQGTLDKLGVFHVQDVVLPATPPAPDLASRSVMVPATIPGSTNTGSDDTYTDTDTDNNSKRAPHVLLVSSLQCADPNVSSMQREMLVAYLQGQFTKDAARVSRVLIVGGGPSAQDPLEGVKELDAFCLQLTKAGIPVDVMPGKDDPTTANWPQRPLHSSLLPHATTILHRTPNPYSAALGEKLIVAMDGTNIVDLQKQVLTKAESTADTPEESESSSGWKPSTELEALQRTLEWSHICPNGPNSVPTVPHLDQDPMVLEHTPHLYVCGNATDFCTKTVGSTTLVCLPKFSSTGEVVLYNLENNNVELLRFEDQNA